jgi:isoleucyl-tRNA synthetase
MNKVREVISVGLQMRADAKIKVRQALTLFTAPIDSIPSTYHNLVLDEMNIKTLGNGEYGLDTVLTPELVREGQMRELLRQIQSLRKSSGLHPQETIILHIQTSTKGERLMEQYKKDIQLVAGIKEFNFAHNDGEEIVVDDLIFIIAIEK